MEKEIEDLMGMFYIEYLSLGYIKVLYGFCNNRLAKTKILGKYKISVDHYGRKLT